MPKHRWLILRLEAPLVAFGGVTVDQVGVTRDFPAASMLTGLIANALGWERTDKAAHQALQNRLVFAARREREPGYGILTDVQNAKLEKSDQGWTTWGAPEGRDGASFGAPHRRQREYHVDACVLTVLRLEPADDQPDLDTIATALDRPARPLFIGRKPCLPSAPLRQGEIMAETAYEALGRVPCHETPAGGLRALWPADEGPVTGPEVNRVLDLADQRNWMTGLHGGTRPVVEGRITPREAAA